MFIGSKVDAIFTLAGDLSVTFMEREGNAALAMIRSCIADTKWVFEHLRPKPKPSPRGPVAHLEIRLAGEIAIGRSGLLPTDDGNQTVTWETRAARLMICEHLASYILPEFLIIGAAVAKSRARQNGEPVSYLRQAAEAVST